MQYIAIKGLDRGGTNVFLSLFHCRPEFFSLSEKTYSRVGMNIDEIPIKRLFKHSMFNGLDNNLKKFNSVRNIVFKMPREAEFTCNTYRYKYCECKCDKMIYLIRNPLRVYISQHHANKRGVRRRLKWNYWHSIINQTMEHVNAFRSSNSENVRLIVFEHFIKNLKGRLRRLLKWVDKDARRDIGPQMSRKFWRRCGLCGAKLIVGGSGYLICVKCRTRVEGHGSFNPAVVVNYKRAMGADLPAFFASKPKMVKEAKSLLGKTLFDYWFYDKEHNYTSLPENI